MFKFFRHIRQTLIIENKTSKYFKYAIGEIILVVIGILIALQINNWNQNYQTKKSNTVFIKKLISELDQNEMRLALLINDGSNGWPGLKTAVKHSDSLLKLTYEGLTKTDLDFVLNARIDAGGSKYSINTSTYEELINTGKLYTLGSDDLIKAVNNYFNLYKREEEYHSENAEISEDALSNLKRGFFRIRLDYEMDSANFNIEAYPWYFDPSSDLYKNLQLSLFEIKEGQSLNLMKTQMMIDSTIAFKNKLINELNNSN